MSTHNPSGKICGYRYCVRCGLIYLRNEATRKAINAGCDWREKLK